MIIQTSVNAGTNRYGMLITTNPSGGTLNYALRVTGATGVRIDSTGSCWACHTPHGELSGIVDALNINTIIGANYREQVRQVVSGL